MKFKDMKVMELKKLAKEAKVKNWWKLKKDELVKALIANNEEDFIQEEELHPDIVQELEEEFEEEEPTIIITLKELALEAGIKGQKARRLLRSSEIERPYKRWEWDQDLHSDTVQKVRELLNE